MTAPQSTLPVQIMWPFPFTHTQSHSWLQTCGFTNGLLIIYPRICHVDTRKRRCCVTGFFEEKMFDLFLKYLYPCTDECSRKSIILCALLHMATVRSYYYKTWNTALLWCNSEVKFTCGANYLAVAYNSVHLLDIGLLLFFLLATSIQYSFIHSFYIPVFLFSEM